MSAEVHVPDNYQYLKAGQIRELESEARSLRERIQAPNPHGADKGDMARRMRRIEGMLSTQQPPDLSPAQRDAWSKEAKRLEAEFVEGMPSAEEMRKNPPGAVDKNLRWHQRQGRNVARWKNIMRALHKGDESPNLANIERFRRHRTPGDLSMEGAEIPGKTFVGTNPSPAYLEGYDRIFGTEDEDPEKATLQARLAEIESELAQLRASKPPKPAKKAEAPKVPMLCGKPIAENRRKAHERFCKTCQEITASESTIPQPSA